jgi:hypothetical protein
MEGEEMEKDASKDGMAPADVIVQAYTLASCNLHNTVTGDPTLPER